MKKSILTLFSLLAVALLFTSAGGCLEKINADIAPSPKSTMSSGCIDSVVIYEKDGNIIAVIQIILQGTYAQTLDKENITVKLNANNVEVYVPVITKEGPNTKNLGYETVEVVLGKANDFENGKKYNVVMNEDKGLKYAFMIEDDVLTTFMPAPIVNAEIKADGKNIIVSVKTAISGSQSVDTANLVKSGNNEYDLYIPIKTAGNVMTLDIKWVTQDFILGDFTQLEDGIYKININGQTVTFEIQNNALIDSSQ